MSTLREMQNTSVEDSLIKGIIPKEGNILFFKGTHINGVCQPRDCKSRVVYKIGKTYRKVKPVVLCQSGYHGARRFSDIWRHGAWHDVYICEGKMIEIAKDKLVCQTITPLFKVDLLNLPTEIHKIKVIEKHASVVLAIRLAMQFDVYNRDNIEIFKTVVNRIFLKLIHGFSGALALGFHEKPAEIEVWAKDLRALFTFNQELTKKWNMLVEMIGSQFILDAVKIEDKEKRRKLIASFLIKKLKK